MEPTLKDWLEDEIEQASSTLTVLKENYASRCESPGFDKTAMSAYDRGYLAAVESQVEELRSAHFRMFGPKDEEIGKVAI